MDSLFGMEFSLPMKFFIAFTVVLILIGMAAYLLRRFGTGTLAVASQRNRLPRLAVVDNTPIDARRKLVIVRRDNVEHLLLIGGPTDVLVEANIVRAGARDNALRNTNVDPMTLTDEEARPPAVPAAPAPRPETVLRNEPPQRPPVFIPVAQAPPVQPHPQAHVQAPTPMPIQYAPPPQPPMPHAPVLQAPVPHAPPPLRAVAPPPMAPPVRLTRPVMAPPPAVPPMHAPVLVPVAAAPVVDTAAVVSAQPPQNYAQAVAATMPLESAAPEAISEEPVAEVPAVEEEQGLADMAHRLEAALRQPVPQSAAPLQAAAPIQRPRPAPVAAPVPRPPVPAPSYENLQREMANLLGRQSGSS